MMDINKFNFHDMRLGNIEIDYFSHKVTMDIVDDKEETQVIEFNKVCDFSISMAEPWGEGVYINDIKFAKEDSTITVVTINSGDTVKIVSSDINLYRKH